MDKETLYNAEVKLLKKYCANCLDLRMKEKLALFLFKLTLLENAEELGKVEDAKIYEKEIFSLLDINPTCCNQNINNCKTCENGYCNIC